MAKSGLRAVATAKGGKLQITGGIRKYQPSGGGIPTSAPPGTYDPALDAQIRQSQRGLAHLREDTALGGTRAREDLMTALSGAKRGKARAFEDYGTRETRGNRDFDTALQGVFRQFGNLGQRQGEAITAAGGMAGGGAARSAAKKRAGNLELARQPIDTGRADLLEDLTRGRGRTTEDFDTQVAEMNRAFARGEQDRGIALARGISEQLAFAGDIEASKLYASKAAHPELYEALAKPPKKPPPKKKGK